MQTSPPQTKFATGPFQLIETPIHAQKCSKPYDPYLEAASIMVLGHNVLIRGLNSIVLQAPHIPPSQTTNFVMYALTWSELLTHHHTMEEERLFPAIEQITGEEGIMGSEVEEHHAFLPGLEAYIAYLTSCKEGKGEFDGKKLNKIISTFAPTLHTHMSTEISTLVSLQRFGPTLPLLDLISTEAAKTPMYVSFTGGTPFFFRNLDLGFEGGLWESWPEVPGVVWWVLQRSVCAVKGGWWEFASCDRDGKLRELKYLEL
ncbi:hypothetical protein B0J14DRAFT_661819 [Halenospora varia]|nr:hypothetical protein B0J14DRAFT_661819 [Halenospora varia]